MTHGQAVATRGEKKELIYTISIRVRGSGYTFGGVRDFNRCIRNDGIGLIYDHTGERARRGCLPAHSADEKGREQQDHENGGFRPQTHRTTLRTRENPRYGWAIIRPNITELANIIRKGHVWTPGHTADRRNKDGWRNTARPS